MKLRQICLINLNPIWELFNIKNFLILRRNSWLSYKIQYLIERLLTNFHLYLFLFRIFYVGYCTIVLSRTSWAIRRICFAYKRLISTYLLVFFVTWRSIVNNVFLLKCSIRIIEASIFLRIYFCFLNCFRVVCWGWW